MPMIRRATLTRRREFKRGFAKTLRADATDAERLLWFLLRDRRLDIRFRRQHPIGPYIADFFCPAAKLIVELDGDQHGGNTAAVYDEIRTRFLNRSGYHVMRFANHEIFRGPHLVIEAILRAANECAPAEHASRVRPLPKNPRGIFDPPSGGG